MKCFDIEYDTSKWRLFIDSSGTRLKEVLLHNGNSFASLPLGHSIHLEDNYNDLSIILEKINYISRISLDGLWRFQNANHVVVSAGRLHKISLLPMLLGQSSRRPPMD
ncbi:hypothetical protein AVEN_227768-1 [Araneus ventricosus]|uniref:Uncharacterized protein n=1 Tax=Araneus ventricosus TaxID=182803 RepID=A0A4Y2IVB9_ARAVE|nr:hypothetical protein AVEN_227768-1 [Araneus ventricosus]